MYVHPDLASHLDTDLTLSQIVAGLVGVYLHDYTRASGLPLGRFIYAEVVAGISLLLGLLWLLPFASSFTSWPVDVFISFAWFAVFGVLVHWMRTGTACQGDTFAWDQIGFARNNICGRWRAVEAFSFLSAIVWLVSALVGLWFVHRERRKARTVHGPYGNSHPRSVPIGVVQLR